MTNPLSPGNPAAEQSEADAPVRRGGGWLDEEPSNQQMALSRRLRMGIVGFLTLAFTILLIWELFEPFQHINTHILLMSGERRATDNSIPTSVSSESDMLLSESERDFVPADFAAEDLLAFQPLRSVLSLRGKGRLTLPGGDLRELLDLRRLQKTLDEMTAEQTDVLVVYMTARVKVDDGEARFEFNIKPGIIEDDQSRLDEILQQLSRSEAAVKLLLIDSGRFECDPALGMVVNEFPRLLEHAVTKTADPSLWVLSSNRPLEISHVSRALERSVFGWFVVYGLNGAADFNRDRQIDLDELTRFVSAEVSEFVQQTTGGAQTQTPVLLWGGGQLKQDQHSPVLLSVSKLQAKAVQDPEQWLESTRQQSIGASVFSIPKTPVTFTPRSDLVNVPSLSNSPLAASLSPNVPSAVEVRGVGTINTNVAPPLPASLLPATAIPSVLPGAKPAQKPAATAKPPGPAESSTTVASANAAAGNPSTDSGKSDAEKQAIKTQSDQKEAIALATLFAEVWKLRDELEQNPWSGSNPSVVAPEEWRRLLARLLMQERQFRAARISDQQQISLVLKTIRDGLTALSQNEPLAFQPGQDKHTADLIGQIQSRIKTHPCHAVRPHTLGLVELFAQHTGTPLEPAMSEIISRLDQLIEQGTPNEFEEWVNKLEPATIDFAEIRLARQLAANVGLGWSTKQFALRVCRIAEKTASIALGSADWIGPEFSEAERLRKVGERTLFDQIGHDREAEGIKWLRLALPKYLRAASDLEEIRFAELLCDQLMLRLPQYVRWHNESNSQATGTPRTSDIHRLADDLAQLALRLDTPSNAQITEIQNLAIRLKELQKKIEASIDPVQVSAGKSSLSLPGDQLQIDSLLNTTLPVGAVRLALLQKSIEYDRRNIAQFRRPKIYLPVSGSHSHLATDWDWPLRMLELELTVAQLGAVGVAPLQTEHAALVQILKELREATTNEESGRSLRERDELIWDQYRRLSGGLKRFYQSWVTVLATAGKMASLPVDNEGRERQRISLRAACRAQKLLPENVISLGESTSPTTLLDITDAHDLLSWQAIRCERQRSGAPRDDATDLTQRIRSYRTQAAKLPQQAPYLQEAPTPISWNGSSVLSLESEAEQPLELRLKWSGVPKSSTWVNLHYDPELIEVKASSEISVTVNGKSSFIEPSMSVDRPRTFELFPDKPTSLRLVIRRRSHAIGRARLVVYAVTNQGSARQDILVSLPLRPSIELGIDGIAGSWSVKERQLRLHPFANRLTSYTFSLINRDPLAREVSLKWLAPRRPIHVEIPQSELNPGELSNLFDSLGPVDGLLELPKIDLPADDKPVKIAFPKPAEEPPAKLEKSLPPVAPHGMIVVVNDPKTGRSLVKRIDVAPQRPRRFLRPQVKYNADRERIEITVVPLDRSQIPLEGVKVRADIVEALPLDAERELEGEIVAPNFEAKLFVAVTSQPEKFLTLQISVDDYPRAFLFRVPCDSNTSELSPILDAMAVSITLPKAKSVFQSPLELLPVELSVDAPDGAFQIPGDMLEVGIDRNNDRDFVDEPVLILNSDRQVDIAKVQFSPEGQFSLVTNVGDFKVNVPATGVRNANTQLLARLTISDRTVWSRPVPVIIDGAPPRVLRVRLTPPGVIAIGTPLKMTVSATDNDLSGVSRIEAAFDTDRKGQISATANLIVATLNPDGNWEAEIPVAELKPGQHTLLVRAVDRVGNVGDVTKVRLTVVSAEDAAKLSMAPVTISGIVTFKEMLAPGIAVTAESADGPKADVPKITPAETDAGGLFQLKGLLPGKWKIKVKGVVRNQTRTSEQEITIKPSQAPQPLKFTLK